jgi:hypothetical protein
MQIPNGSIQQRNSIETIVENKKRNEMKICFAFKRFCAKSRILYGEEQTTFLDYN